MKKLLFVILILRFSKSMTESVPAPVTAATEKQVQILEQRIDNLNLSMEEKLQLKTNLEKNPTLRNQILNLINSQIRLNKPNYFISTESIRDICNTTRHLGEGIIATGIIYIVYKYFFKMAKFAIMNG